MHVMEWERERERERERARERERESFLLVFLWLKGCLRSSWGKWDNEDLYASVLSHFNWKCRTHSNSHTPYTLGRWWPYYRPSFLVWQSIMSTHEHTHTHTKHTSPRRTHFCILATVLFSHKFSGDNKCVSLAFKLTFFATYFLYTCLCIFTC